MAEQSAAGAAAGKKQVGGKAAAVPPSPLPDVHARIRELEQRRGYMESSLERVRKDLAEVPAAPAADDAQRLVRGRLEGREANLEAEVNQIDAELAELRK